MKVIGITGGTGCGKTSVLRMMERLGCFAIDADEVYHRLLRYDKDMRDELIAEFPTVFVDGELDRRALGHIVYYDEERMKALTDITHYHIIKDIERLLERGERNGAPMAVIDAILLFESGLDRICDLVVGVTAPREVRMRRIMKRDDITREKATERIDAQPDEDFYRENCDYLISNPVDDGSIQDKTIGFYDNLVNGKILPKDPEKRNHTESN